MNQFCESCGQKMLESTVFCASCGTKVGEPNSARVISKAPANDIADRAKLASQDAVQAVKLFAVDPTGGLLPAFQNLDKQRAISASIAFALLFDFCLLFGISRLYSALREHSESLGFLGSLGFSQLLPDSPNYTKLFFLGLVPFVAMTIALLLARLVFRGTGEVEGDTFTAGAALLPFGAFIFLTALLGYANAEVIAVLFLFALCYTILILFTGCTRIARVSDAGAAMAVPLVLLVSAYISKVIISAMWSSGVTGQ